MPATESKVNPRLLSLQVADAGKKGALETEGGPRRDAPGTGGQPTGRKRPKREGGPTARKDGRRKRRGRRGAEAAAGRRRGKGEGG